MREARSGPEASGRASSGAVGALNTCLRKSEAGTEPTSSLWKPALGLILFPRSGESTW